MINKTSLNFRSVTLLAFLMIFSTAAFSQVGINTLTPSEMLDVNGNLKLDGAFMPGNAAGTTDKILLSKGPGTPPAWGPGFINTSEIENIAKVYLGPLPAIPNNSVYVLTVTDANMTAAAVIDVNFSGTMPTGPAYGYNFTVHALPEPGQAVIYITNVSGGTMSAGVGLNLIIYYQ